MLEWQHLQQRNVPIVRWHQSAVLLELSGLQQRQLLRSWRLVPTVRWFGSALLHQRCGLQLSADVQRGGLSVAADETQQ